MDIRTIKTAIIHDNCPDGLASAMILKDANPSIDFRFVQYGTAEYETLQPEPGILFADFSPPASRAQEFIDARACILDHHKTAKDVVARFGENGVFGDEVTEPGVCGAVLCYRHAWLPRKSNEHTDLLTYCGFIQRFAMLAGVRDTWQRQSPFWDEACKQADILMFMPREQWLEIPLTELAETWMQRFSWVGDVLSAKNTKHIARTVKGARRVKTEKGTRLVIFEGVRAISDAAELLDQETDIVIGFNYFEEDTADGRRVTKMIASTRSHTTYDCSSLAKFYGGGGHTKAAGFNVEVKVKDLNPYDTILELVSEFEVSSNS